MPQNLAIKLENVKKSYFLSNGDEIPILKGINLEIKKGEFVAIMGESGCGKSVTAHILTWGIMGKT